MLEERIVSTRPDRELRKKITKPGDYSLVPYEESRCKVAVTNVKCTDETGSCPIESESQIFSSQFNGIVLIGDSDFFIDRDLELILQQMCNGEECEATMIYRNGEGKLVKQITCTINLVETTEEQLVSDWSWERLLEASRHHKEKGVELVKQNKITEAFRRFNKALKFLIAIEPIDLSQVPDSVPQETTDLKVKLLNNLAHCQLQFNEYEAALDLCNRSLKYDPNNAKSLYRKTVAYQGLGMYEEAWNTLQEVLRLDKNDRAAQQKVKELKPKLIEINKEYSVVIKNMFR